MDLSEIVANIDIVSFIGERIEIKRIGKTEKACCPFHKEKTPSFVIYEDSQRFHCFGCGASGDALDFVREYERLSQADAIAYIKHYTGVKDDFIPERGKTPKMKRERADFIKMLMFVMVGSVKNGKAFPVSVKRNNITCARLRRCR